MAKLKNRHKHKGFRFSVFTGKCKIPPILRVLSVNSFAMENPYLRTLNTTIQFWDEFKLQTKIESMKASMQTIVKSQESSQKARKDLATKTKDIRTVAANERMTYMKNLLKSYQEEIDHLTVRSQ